MGTIAGGAVEGTYQANVTKVTAAYTVTVNDEYVQADATGGAFSVTLPAPSSVNSGQIVTVQRANSGGNAVTVSGTLNTGGFYALSGKGSLVTVISDGSTNWNVRGTVS